VPHCPIMPTTFKSKVTGDLLMLDVHAKALLDLLGKDAGKGIITPEQMPQALSLLHALSDEAPQEEEPSDAQDGEAINRHRSPPDTVSPRKRAWPLIKMLEACQAANVPVVWGV
jgi:Domain of unknown function (DUF1840)